MRTLCIWHLQYLESFRNGCLFCTYWLIRNLNCAHSHHASYGERCSNHHFQHWAQFVYEIYSVFKVLEIAVCFAHFGLFEISTPVMRNMLTIANIVLMIITNISHTVYIYDFKHFTSFPNFSLFYTFFILRNFYSAGAPHANYVKHSIIHHFQHCAHCVYEIYSIIEAFEIAGCFAHFVVFEIWTPLAMVNVVQIIISNIAHSVYLRFTMFWNFSKLLFVWHILAYSKFLLRWGASC